jgi:25S rRNA (cytosine2278-C5)-methyltransferase
MSRQYLSAGGMVKSVCIDGMSFKQICGRQKTVGKTDFALASETIKYFDVIRNLCQEADITAQSLDVGNDGVMYVMIYELLFGKGKIQGGGAVKRKIVEVLPLLEKLLALEMKDRGITEKQELLSLDVQRHENLPRYIRVNEIKMEFETAKREVMRSLNTQDIVVDNHIPSLLVLPAALSSLGEHPWVKNGQLIIQDKASCFPSQIAMDQYTGGDIIDCCAAPGNKTSHMAAILHRKILKGEINNGDATAKGTGSERKPHIYAFDRSSARADLLSRRIHSAGAQNIVTVHNEDFLQVDVRDSKYENVRVLLLDPSCSGSGVVRALDRVTADSEDVAARKERLDQLRTFQVQAIKKVMTFRSAESFVYSTCSIHEEENESVVAEVLHSPEGKGWQLTAPARMADWTRRGVAFEGLSKAQSDCLIRCHPDDGMNGFFVALFTRKNKSKKSQQPSSADVVFPSAVTTTAVTTATPATKVEKRKLESASLPTSTISQPIAHHQITAPGVETVDDSDDMQSTTSQEDYEYFLERFMKGDIDPNLLGEDQDGINNDDDDNSDPPIKFRRHRQWRPASSTKFF